MKDRALTILLYVAELADAFVRWWNTGRWDYGPDDFK